ncbi:hypothetical protein ACHOLT_14430 [Desulfitobacterium sp. Sab5]|uniref:hypothetical protein n=1 Tax=Desulfitobacterium nosdiversum TaxID=3375356 RepID=UPI003CF1EFC0
MSIHLATISGAVISLILSIVGAMAAEKKIVQGLKSVESIDHSMFNLTFIGIALIELLPVLMLVFTIILIID